jgi:hypothetical protein
MWTLPLRAGLSVTKKVLCPRCMSNPAGAKEKGKEKSDVAEDSSVPERDIATSGPSRGEEQETPTTTTTTTKEGGEVPTFNYREVIDSIQSHQKMVCLRGGHQVSVRRAAPDLLLAGVRTIKESELRKERKVGDGGTYHHFFYHLFFNCFSIFVL